MNPPEQLPMGAILCKGKKGHMKVNAEPTEEEEEEEEEEARRVHISLAKNQKTRNHLKLQNEQAKAMEQDSALNPVDGDQAAQSTSVKQSDGS